MIYDDFVWWTGTVEDIMDPEKLGRIKVRMYGIHTDDKSEIPTEALPWAQTMMPITSASIDGVGQSPTGIVVGSWVVGFFRDGENAQDPVVWGSIYGITQERAGTYGEQGGLPLIGGSEENQSDVNKVNTENRSDTIAEYKENSRVTEPSAQDDRTYPDGTGTVSSRSGHHKEINDTPGNERILTYHVGGSFQEYQHNGDVVDRIVADYFQIIEDDLYIHVGKDCEWIVEGDLDITIGGNMSEEVGATKEMFGGATITIDSNGNIELNP